MEQTIDLLEAVRSQLGLSVTDLWWRYFAVGGMTSSWELDAVLARALLPTTEDCDLLAVALNERSRELGIDRAIAYFSDAEDA